MLYSFKECNLSITASLVNFIELLISTRFYESLNRIYWGGEGGSKRAVYFLAAMSCCFREALN